MGGGDHYPSVQKGQTPHTVGTQYAVGISAKRSTGTVELTNMGGGDRCKKVKAHCVGGI